VLAHIIKSCNPKLNIKTRIALNQRAKSHTHKWILNGIVYCKEGGEPMQLKVKYRKDGSTVSFMRLTIWKNSSI